MSERLVVFCLFSDLVSISEKVKIWRILKAMKNNENIGTVGNGLQQMPIMLSYSTQLENLVGSDSWVIFDIFKVCFIESHPKYWEKDSNFLKIKAQIKAIPVVM